MSDSHFSQKIVKKSERLRQKKKDPQQRQVHELLIPESSKGVVFGFSANGMIAQSLKKITREVYRNKSKQIYDQDSNSQNQKKGISATDFKGFFQSLKNQQNIEQRNNKPPTVSSNKHITNNKNPYPFQSVQNKKITLSHINSIQFVNDNQKCRKIRDLMDSQDLFSSLGKQYDISVENQKKKPLATCTCKKSQCLKLYCECFRKQLVCNKQCSCNNCANHEENMTRILAVREQYMHKKRITNELFSEKGCKCTKSNCLKRYCDCFRRGLQCTKYCNCLDCCNGIYDDHRIVMEKIEYDQDKPINYIIRDLDQK